MTNQTNQEIIEDFKESLEKFRINPFLKGHVQEVVEAQYLEFRNLSLNALLKALEAKDAKAELEQRNLIHRVPIELSYAGMIQWTEDEIEKLNQLK